MLFKRSFLLTIIFLLVWSFQILGYSIVKLGPGYFPEVSRNRPIANGEIYVGIPDLDPEVVSNQRQLYIQQEDGTIVAVAQPIYTSAGGVPVYSGSPVTLLVNGDYSLKVLDSSGVQVYYIPLMNSSSEEAGNTCTPDYNAIDQGVIGDNNTIKACVDEIGFVNKGLILLKHTSGSMQTAYVLTTNETIPANITIEFELGAYIDGAGTLAFASSPDVQLKALPREQVFAEDLNVTFGEKGTRFVNWWKNNSLPGTTDMTIAMQSAFDAGPGTIQLLPEIYAVSALTLKTDLTIKGGTLLYAGTTHNVPVIDGSSLSNIVFDNVTIDADYETNIGLRILSSNSVAIKNNSIIKNIFANTGIVGGYGIHLQNVSNFTIDNILVDGAGGTPNGIQGDAYGAPRGILITRTALGESSGVISNTTFDRVGVYKVDKTMELDWGEDGDSLQLESYDLGGGVFASMSVEVKNCIFRQSPKRAIKIQAQDTVIRDNTIYGLTGGTGTAGGLIDILGKNNTVINNYIEDPRVAGACITSYVLSSLISGNKLITDAVKIAIQEDVYINPSTGSNNNIGAVATPFKTLGYLSWCLSLIEQPEAMTGTTKVWLANGDYSGSVFSFTSINKKWNLAIIGNTADKTLVYGVTVVIDGAGGQESVRSFVIPAGPTLSELVGGIVFTHITISSFSVINDARDINISSSTVHGIQIRANSSLNITSTLVDKAGTPTTGITVADNSIFICNTWNTISNFTIGISITNGSRVAVIQTPTFTGNTTDISNSSGLLAYGLSVKSGFTASVADGDTITHDFGTTPSWVIVTPSVTGEFVSVTAKSATTFTVAIKKHDNSAGTTQTLYWQIGI